MPKPHHFHNRPKISEESGDGAYKAEEDGERTGTGGKGVEGKGRASEGRTPSPTEQTADTGRDIQLERGRRRRRRRIRQRRTNRRKRRE